MFFDQTFKNIKRTQEILRVLFKYGFEDVIAHSPIQKLIPTNARLTWRRDEKSIFESTRYERVRMVFEELGPTFIKLAQVLSNRPDILPEALINEFTKLQSEVPPFEFSKVREIIEKEMGHPLKEVFKFFDEKTLGSASIGQVHMAILKDGTEVVVKVQRPNVQQVVATDLSIMRDLVTRAEGIFEKNGVINAIDVVDAFERSMSKELDYNTEARNINLFRNAYAHRTDFYVPKVYREFSTERVLVLEMIKGCKITDLEQLKTWGLNPERIAEQGIDIYLSQIFEHGFFHADPHPGNIIITREGTICLIDFGMIGTLMKKDKYNLAGVFVGMAQQDPQSMANCLRKLAIDDSITDMRSLEYDLNEIIEDFALLDVSESNIAEMSVQLQKVIFNYRLRVPGGVFIILRALAILEGIGKSIHPNFQTYEFIKPYGLKIFRDKLDPTNVTDDILARMSDFSDFLGSFPVEVRDILVQTRRGKLHFEYELTNYKPLLNKADRIANRMIAAAVICALLISSAIVSTAQFPASATTDSGMPYVSVFGFSAAVALGVIVFLAIWRTRKY